MTDTSILPEVLSQKLGSSNYGLKALEAEKEKVFSSAVGTRNTQLNKSAFKIGQLLASGEVDEALTVTELTDAGLMSGLTEDEVRKTLRSGLDAGKANPRAPIPKPDGSKPEAALKGSDTPQEKSRWEIYSMADAYVECPPVEYVAHGLFELPSLNIVYGAPASFKSFLMADLLACVSLGKPWLPPPDHDTRALPIRTSQNPVLWIDFDNGRRRTHERFGALGRHYGLKAETPFHYTSMPSPWLNASDSGHTRRLTLLVQKLGVKMVVIDNLLSVSGGIEENSSKMVKVMSHLRLLSEETESAVIAIHHSRKGGSNSSNLGDNLRGHSSIAASVDLALLVERAKGSNIATIQSTKTRGEDVYPFSATYACDHQTNGGLDTACFFGLIGDDNSSDRAIDQTIISLLTEADERLNKGELVEKVSKLLDASERRVRDRLERMKHSGQLNCVTGEKNAKYYSLP